MKAIHRKRLAKLAAALRQIPRKQFDLQVVVQGDPDKLGCGSVACAVGHCPLIFPRSWEWSKDEYLLNRFNVKLRGKRSTKWYRSAEIFFGLSSDDVLSMFVKSHGYRYNATVTPKMVARKIEKFLKDAA
jgi:hypothetical protein